MTSGTLVFSLSAFRKINLIAFNGLWYGIWTLAGLKIEGFWLYLGLSPVLLYALWHLYYTPLGILERRLVLITLPLSLFWEGIWQLFGIVNYYETGIPLWIIAMWVNFSLSLCHSWWPWIRTPLSGILLGLAAGLLPYFAAEKMGCVHINHREILLLIWAIHGLLLAMLLRETMNQAKNHAK
jgi:hypothetical protein